PETIWAWPAIPARRPLERLQALWKNRRRDIPQGGVDTSFARRSVADRAGIDLSRFSRDLEFPVASVQVRTAFTKQDQRTWHSQSAFRVTSFDDQPRFCS